MIFSDLCLARYSANTEYWISEIIQYLAHSKSIDSRYMQFEKQARPLDAEVRLQAYAIGGGDNPKRVQLPSGFINLFYLFLKRI